MLLFGSSILLYSSLHPPPPTRRRVVAIHRCEHTDWHEPAVPEVQQISDSPDAQHGIAGTPNEVGGSGISANIEYPHAVTRQDAAEDCESGAERGDHGILVILVIMGCAFPNVSVDCVVE